MELLANWRLDHGGDSRVIELLRGDLSRIPPEHAVDILVVSAFAGDYAPTRGSLIGALDRAGVSVAGLAESKAVDMREQFSCWLSQPLPEGFGFRRLLCIESSWRGSPPEITDDLFRALAPFLLADCPHASIAMPVIGAGDQGFLVERMIPAILNAAVAWIRRGLPLRLMKVVVYSPESARIALERFVSIRDAGEGAKTPGDAAAGYDVFLSYCHADAGAALRMKIELEKLRPGVRIFFDRESLLPGASWLMKIAESLDHAKRVAALFTPSYWNSTACKDEFAAALTRQADSGSTVLFPVYVSTAPIPYMFRNLQYVDCRESDFTKLAEACAQLAAAL